MATHKTATRTISNARALRAVGLFYSHKNQEHIARESQLERDGFLFMECHPAVRVYPHQPESAQAASTETSGIAKTSGPRKTTCLAFTGNSSTLLLVC